MLEDERHLGFRQGLKARDAGGPAVGPSPPTAAFSLPVNSLGLSELFLHFRSCQRGTL